MLQCQVFTIPVNDDFLSISPTLEQKVMRAYIWVLLQLVLDESEQVLLIHTSRVVDMGIDLSDIVEITEKSAMRTTGHIWLTDEEQPTCQLCHESWVIGSSPSYLQAPDTHSVSSRDSTC